MKKSIFWIIFFLVVSAGYYYAQAKEGVMTVAPETPVKTVTLTDTHASRKIAFSGFARGKNHTVIYPRIAGYTVRLTKLEGDFVHKGEVLAVLEASELRAGASGAAQVSEQNSAATEEAARYFKQKVAEAEASLDQVKASKRNGDATSHDVDVAQESVISAKRLRDAEIAKALTSEAATQSQSLIANAMLTNTIVRAPFSGVILERQASLGNLVSPSTPLYTLATPEELEVFVSVPRSYRSAITSDTSITLETEAGDAVPAHIISIAESLGERSEEMGIRIALGKEARQHVHIGDHVQALITLTEPTANERILIPEKALLWVYDDTYVYRVKDNHAHMQKVTLGQSIGDQREVLDGLTANNIVVIEGQHSLHDNASVHIE